MTTRLLLCTSNGVILAQLSLPDACVGFKPKYMRSDTEFFYLVACGDF